MKEGIKVKNKKTLKKNEIELIRRTKANYTHEVLEDHNIQEITLWKISQKKIIQFYFYNIFSLGITYFISCNNPLYYIKFCCIPSTIKEADYFLVKDIYDTYKLCYKETKRYSQTPNGLSDDLSLEFVLHNNNLNNQILGFSYNSKFYEYNETKNKMVPNYFNLSILSNKRIYQLFIEGHTSLNRVKKFTERYGKNICKFDFTLINYYFKKAELFLLIMGVVLAGIEAYCGSTGYVVILVIFTVVIFIIQQIVIKNLSLEEEDTLDGAKKQIKVKRRYLAQENRDYCYIDNIDLIPGDLIYLTKGDEVPCDGIILEGECILGNSMVNGSINEINKKALDNNSYYFNYEQNNTNILFHGSKLIKTYSKLENNSILVLALNTGSNTFKANQLANIRYLFKRNKQYNEIYSKFCGQKNTLFFHGLFLFILGSIAVMLIYFFILKTGFNKALIDLILNILSRSFFPSFHIVCSFVIFIGAIYLSNDHVKCYDKSRLLYAGSVNTIFFDKTGTLSEKYLEIGGFFPVTLSQNSSEVSMKYYNINQIKDLNGILIEYYSEYQREENNMDNDLNLKENNYSIKYNEKIREKNIKAFQKKINVLFLECMVSCNILDKKNNQIAGNAIEKEIFTHLKWEMKVNNMKEEIKEYSNQKLKKGEDNEEENLEQTNIDLRTTTSKRTIIFEDDGKIKISNEMMNIYPNSYYKITEGKILDNKKKSEISDFNNIHNMNNKQVYINETLEESSKDDITRDFSESISKDKTPRQDFYKAKEKVYFLRIFRRFIKTGTLYSSALVYNTITDSVFFFIKGPPEEVLPYCNYSFLPKDIYRIINFYRKNGFINLILAGKELDSKEEEQLLNEESYKDDLIFYGLITLKNKLKKEAKPVIKQLKKLNCDIILNTGDNIYNSLAVGYESGIINEKNIFHIDINKITKKLVINTFNDLTKNDIKSLKDDKSTNRNIDKLSNLKNSVFNFRQISTKRIGDLLASKIIRNINKEKNENNNSKKNLESILDKKNTQMNFNNSLFKSVRMPIKEQNNLRHKIENSNIENKSHKKLDLSKSGRNPINQSINSKNEFIDKTLKTSIAYQDKEQNVLILSTEGKDSYSNNIINSMPQQIKQEDSFSKKKNKIRTSAVFPFSDGKILGQHNSEKMLTKSITPNINLIDSNPKGSKFKQISQPFHFNSNAKDYSPSTNERTKNEYFPAKLKHMRNECIYCVSGKALRYIYNNRHNPDYRKLELPILLNHIKKFGKIFYEMHAKDKSLLIDIFRKMPNKITCMVGDGQNDLDAMMTAHVGINMNKPVNKNTVLCHFYPTDGSLFCIAKIIRYGRVIYENIYLLGISSFLCALNIVLIMLLLCSYDIKFVKYELDFMSCNYFLLSILAFSVKPDLTIESCLLFHNPTLLKYFFMIISLGNLFINFGFAVLYISIYSKNEELREEDQKNILGNFIYFLCYIQILSMIFAINSINFYRISHRNNYKFWIIMIILIIFVSFLFCIFGYSFHPILYNILAFEYNPKNVDTFDDKNKIQCFAIFIGNILVYYLFVTLMFFLFSKKADNDYQKKNKILINKKED